ncbi:hypothetical protein ACTWPT_55025 [Nonomuraea sp. 3N208]|uniref:hypothetical protein n=1 Tax=Nonomuraea sp. 3N208 TaxID=3457421 RepID=UPI003FD347A4
MTLTKPLRSVFITLAVGALALLAAPAPASAGEYDLDRCKAGMVCLYKGSLADADLIDWSYGTFGPRSMGPNTHYYLVNNGRQQTGQDHFYFEYAGVTQCLHYNQGKTLQSGAWKHYYAPNTQIMVDQRWGGECP